LVAGRRGKIGRRKRGENENEELIWGLLSKEKQEKKIGEKNLSLLNSMFSMILRIFMNYEKLFLFIEFK
jgi:hypothetical protein